MSTANLKWSADTTEAELQILALKRVIGSIRGESSKSLSSTSGDFKRVSGDAGKAAHDTKRAWRDTESGLLSFDRAAKQVSKSLSGGPLGLFGAIGSVAAGALRMGGFVQKATLDLGGLVSAGGSAGGIMGTLGTALGGLAPILGAVTAGAGLLAAALVVLPALIAAVTFVAVALLDTLTTLAAIVGGLVAPLGLVTGLLGGLGAAFAYTAAQSFKNKASLQDQKDALLALHVAQQTYNTDLAKYGAGATQTEKALLALHAAQEKYRTAQQGVALGTLDLTEKFHDLVGTLSRDFQPEILALGQAAATALTYLGQIAKLPLDDAFRNLATRGVRLLSKFVYGVANVLKRPFRLAIEIAFGRSGSTVQSAVTDWWTSFSQYLFGYTKTQTVQFGFKTLVTKTQVDGAFQPFLDWFGRQHFTQTGIRWSNEIIDGFINSGGARKLGQWAGTVADHAGHVAGRSFMAALGWELLDAIPRLLGYLYKTIVGFSRRATRALGAGIVAALGHAWDWVASKVSSVYTSIVDSARNANRQIGAAIVSAIGGAWQHVKNRASEIWAQIVRFVEQPLSIHIDWPSPPGWLSWLIGGGNGGSITPTKTSHGVLGARAAGGPVSAGTAYIVGEHRPELFVPNTSGRIMPNVPASGIGGGGRSISIVVNVAGSVVTEKQLLQSIRSGLLRMDIANGTVGGRTISNASNLLAGYATRRA